MTGTSSDPRHADETQPLVTSAVQLHPAASPSRVAPGTALAAAAPPPRPPSTGTGRNSSSTSHRFPTNVTGTVSGGTAIIGSHSLAAGARTFAFIVASLITIAMIIMTGGEAITQIGNWSVGDYIYEFGEDALQIGHALIVFFAIGWIARNRPTREGLILALVGSLFVVQISISTYYDVISLQSMQWSQPSWVCVTVLLHALLIPERLRYHGPLAIFAVVVLPAAWLIGAQTSLLDIADPATGSIPDARDMLTVAASIWICVVVGLFISIRENKKRTRFEKVRQQRDAAQSELRQLGSFILEERLGQGGMGEVWRARHHLLARYAAIKLIRPSLTQSRANETEADRQKTAVLTRRFEQEAYVTAQLRSPHTVQLFDFGQTADGSLYYAMELLEGINLEQLVRQFGPQPQERVVHLLYQACESLAEAHAMGLVHRDIKPANLFLCRLGVRCDVLKVLDFGIVRRTDSAINQASPNAEPLTNAGEIAGTPGYLAPEQALGRTLDARADLYAIGAVGYWLLTGERAWKEATPIATVLAQLNQTLTPIASKLPADKPAPDPRLIAILEKLLSPRPEDRPENADVLATELRLLGIMQEWTQDRAIQWAEESGVPFQKLVPPESPNDTPSGAQYLATSRAH